MKLRLLIILISVFLLVSCQNSKLNHNNSDNNSQKQVSINLKEQLNPKNVQENNKGKGSFKEEKSSEEFNQINNLINKYELGLIEAINKNNFKLVEPYLKEGSELYNDQKKLVDTLYSQGVKEEYISHEVGHIYYVSNDIFRVEVIETIKILNPKKGDVKKDYQWIYTAERIGNDMKLSKIEKWSNFENEILNRKGSVKTDRFYADEICGNFDTFLVESLNHDNSSIDNIFDNEDVKTEYNLLIKKIKKYGKNFELLKSEFINYPEAPKYIAKKKIILSHLDSSNKAKELNLTLIIAAKEYRTGNSIVYGGYAKITEIKVVEIK